MALKAPPLVTLILLALSTSACNPDTNGVTSILTVNLVEASEIREIKCEGAFAAGSDKIHKSEDGSDWIWLKGKDGTLSHHCRKQSDGAVTAWNQASGNQKATHNLTFESGKTTARFTPIS